MEQVQDYIERSGLPTRERWVLLVALTTVLFAAAAVVASFLAGEYASKAMAEQMQAADQWNVFQVNGIKSELLASEREILGKLGKPSSAERQRDAERYAREQEEIKIVAQIRQKSAADKMEAQSTLGWVVAFLQIAIAIGAIAILARNRLFWVVSVLCGCTGVALLVQVLLLNRP
jgi:hypothetical protein